MLNLFIVSLLRGAPYVESHDSPGHPQMPGRSWRAGQAPRRIAQHPEQGGPLPLPALTHQSPEIGKGKKTNFPFHSAFTIFAKNGVFSKDEEMPAK